MAVLGDAIASYLSNLRGLYSVELPIALENDIIGLVQACNAVSPKRAILVTDGSYPSNIPVTAWVEILKWRTDDDRVFVWARGSRDPDSSFRSAVKPFISGRFPGDQGCECTLDLLAEISIQELWKRRNLRGIDDTFEAFRRTIRWVAGILWHSFEQGGSTLNVHWSDKFLIHWAKLLELLNQEISNFAEILEPRHAWEILRLAGLPAPAQLAQKGNPFWSAPEDLPERDWQRVASKWQKATEEFMQPDGKIAVLLTALDAKVPGTRKISSWRELRWDILQSLSPDAVAPERGMAIFTTVPSSTILSKQVPQYPVAPVHSWWGVTDRDIEEAAEALKSSISFQPETSCASLIPVFLSRSGEYWLDISKSIPTYNITSRKWIAQLEVQDIQMIYRENWHNLFVSPLPPVTMRDGDAWINPDALTLSLKGKELKVINTHASVGLGGQLTLQCNIIVDYTATIKNNADISSIDTISGSWNPLWSLRLKTTVRDCIDGNWGAKRDIDASVSLVIPSPYSPTILVLQERNIIFAPDSGDTFTTLLGTGSTWSSFSTPDILLQEEGRYEISTYDGSLDPVNPQFAQRSMININGISLIPALERLWNTTSDLDDGDIFGAQGPSGALDVAVVKVKERAGNYSSGLLSAMRGRPAGRRQPSSQVRSSLLGQYQDQVTTALAKLGSNSPNSLYQYIVSSAENPVTWPSHAGKPSPEFLFNLQPGFSLPGIGNGPSPKLANCSQWQKFMKSLTMICSNIGLNLASKDFWLSGFDPGTIKTSLLKDYIEAHRELVQFAKTVGPTDTFWASYPFSLIVVDGVSGASLLGELLAVLLSPLHPARLAWAFSVAFTAKQGVLSQGLLGFAEGWNIPYTGFAINSTGQEIPLIAVPTDPGTEQDFATWSALAVLTHTGLAELPASAASLPLPWGGRTGINHKVVERAIKDYLNVHPHINSFEADIRSVTKSPRSQEIDNALLQFVGAGKISEMHKLSGGMRVWDSEDRLGMPPTRDKLFQARDDDEYKRPFEWRSYSSGSLVNSDVAFVENANVHLAITNGETSGILGPLPLRRFCPPILKNLDQGNLVLDQNYSVHPDDDLLGLSSLLAEIEQDGIKALRSSPQSHALGIGQDARWEVLGTFNMDPALLASVVTKATNTNSADKRLLWEWRPSWLNQERRSENELAKRPYYVVAKVPASLLKALEYRQGFSEKQAGEVLSELGYRGVGLASLFATGGSQESAAAGFFYAMRLLLPLEKHPLQSSWTTSKSTRTIYGLLPIDPVYSVLSELAETSPSDRRADLLVLQVTQESEDFTRVCLVPVEIKHHGNPQNPEPIPPDTDLELKRAREQLAQMSMMIETIGKSLHIKDNGNNNVVNCYTKRLGFAMLLDLAMSLTRVPIQADDRGKITSNILNGRIAVSGGDQVLLWFAPGSTAVTGDIHFVDPHGSKVQNNRCLREIFLDPTAVPGLWWNDGPASPGPNEECIRNVVDAVMEEVMSACVSSTGASTTNLRTELMELLGLGPVSTIQNGLLGDSPDNNKTASDIISLDNSAKTTEHSKMSEYMQETEHKSKDTENVYGSISLWDEEIEEGHTNSTLHSRFADADVTTSASARITSIPRSLIGWNTETSRWALLGNLEGTNEFVALDFDHPKTIGIFGYMGSGKTYLLGTLIEAALEAIPGINKLAVPLSVVIFNYRRNASDRFELSSLARSNQTKVDVDRLALEYGANPQALQDIHVLCLPGQRDSTRLSEYEGIPSSELLFNPSTLTVEDWELLMGDPGSVALFARTIRHALGELRALGEITLEKLEEFVLPLLPMGSRRSASIRFRFVRKYISSTQGTKFEQILKPGRAVIVDLRDALFTKEDALRFFLVCANHISRVQGRFNKMVIFDEAHEYLSNEFGEKIEARIRLMRHEGTSYVFATQDVGSIPPAIQRFITTKFVFSLGTRQNIEDLTRFAPEFKNQQLLGIRPGYCLIQANESIEDVFRRPRLVRIRPRVTQHGGDTQIFSKEVQTEGEER